MNKIFRETRIVTRNLITDWVQSVRNLLGLRLISYEKGIDKEAKELEDKYLNIGKKVKWFRYDIEQAGNGSFIISLYGEYQ